MCAPIDRPAALARVAIELALIMDTPQQPTQTHQRALQLIGRNVFADALAERGRLATLDEANLGRRVGVNEGGNKLPNGPKRPGRVDDVGAIQTLWNRRKNRTERASAKVARLELAPGNILPKMSMVCLVTDIGVEFQ